MILRTARFLCVIYAEICVNATPVVLKAAHLAKCSPGPCDVHYGGAVRLIHRHRAPRQLQDAIRVVILLDNNASGLVRTQAGGIARRWNKTDLGEFGEECIQN